MSDFILGDGVKDLYPSERNAIISTKHELTSALAYRANHSMTEDKMKRQYEEQARNRFGEIGFEISVQWVWDDPETGLRSPDVNDDPDDMTLFWNPRVVIERRSQKIEELDHGRMRHEVVSGEADGKVGYVDPNTGLVKEDPKSKLILP